MLKIIAIVVAVVIAGVLAIATTKPDTFRVQRQIQVQAPPEKIFPLINDFHRWRAWSPYEKLDADMQRQISGAPQGQGAVYAWDGQKSGQGRMEIVSTAAPNQILIQLDFIKPMEAHNIAEFRLEPQGGATQVTWSVQGRNAFVSKVFQVFVNMDTLLGSDFEKGLIDLKKLAEG
jgi:carbon monoxide dehydrogenase subunit G